MGTPSWIELHPIAASQGPDCRVYRIGEDQSVGDANIEHRRLSISPNELTEHPLEDALLRLDVGRPDHLRPFLGFLRHQLRFHPFTTVLKRGITYTVGDAQARFARMKSASKKRTPSIVNLTVKRRYLTQREIDRLMDCARKHGRYGHRDATMILVAYRHGLRASEVCDLQWQQIELSEGRLHVHRVKNGIPSVHPIRGDEMRGLRKLRRDYPRDAYVFVSERGGPISPIGFHRLIQRVGEAAKMPFPIHPHMLRHACGFKLANDGHDTRALQHYLGHRNIQHTVRYTEM